MGPGILWDMGLMNVTIHLVLVLLGLNLFFRFWRKPMYYLSVRNILKGHHWIYLTNFENPTHCNVCKLLLLSGGATCDRCGICTDLDCLKKANKKLPCKAVTSDSSVTKHHWVKGNLPLGSACHVCEDECGAGSDLSDFRCCWCHWTVHETCLPNMADLCTFGDFKNFVIPPSCITLKASQRVRLRVGLNSVISDIRNPSLGPQWKPLIVIGNSKSGSSEASQVLSAARRCLNAIQVVDLVDQDPTSALHICDLMKEMECRLLIAGGDGTIAWVLSAVEELKLNPLPSSAVLPLGTGNDLSRVLGWGAAHDASSFNFETVLRKIQTARTVQLDRWNAELSPFRHLGLRFPKRSVKFNNYFSVGVDARVALNFHKTRQSPLYLFSHRLFNKFLYFTYGTKDVVEQSCEGLEKDVQLYLDDANEPLKLPPLQAIVFLNIDCWGGGVRPWTMGTGGAASPSASFSDGVMEIIGVVSSLHIAQMQIGLSEPLRLGQAKSIKLVLRKRLPVQADGEPWEENPCEMTIAFMGQVPMLMSLSSL